MTSFPIRLTTGLVALAACIALPSCESSKKTSSADSGLVDYTESSSRKTDAERAARPFDEAGNYREDWVAKGEGIKGVRDTPTSSAYTQEPDATPVSHTTASTGFTASTGSTGSSGTRKSSGSSAGSSSRSTASRPKPKPRPKPVAKPTYVKVKPGDTLYGLSKSSGVSIAAIKAANGLKSDTIVDGKSLKIPKKK